jgi:hypothetical protein
MVRVDPTIRLPEFMGEGLEDQETHLFIYENIWEANKITYEYRNFVQLEITFRNLTSDWYMGLAVNNPMGEPTTAVDAKKQLINEFHKSRLEDQFMNEIIDIK